MLLTKRTTFLLAGAVVVSLFSVRAISAGVVKESDSVKTMNKEAAYKAEHDTDPHLPLTAEQEQMLAIKDAAAGVPSTSESPKTAAASAMTTAAATAASSYPTTSGILMNQTPQLRSYWCGPATVHEALHQLGVWVSQEQLAIELGTTIAGTAWSGGPTSTGHPVPDVLNTRQTKNYFVPVAVPLSYSGILDTYKTRLMKNIAGVRAPLIGDAWEVEGSDIRLVGHPSNRDIFHWFDIRGYSQSGVKTMYEDTVHDATSIGWSASVPAYSTMDSWKILRIMSGRGYVW